MSHRYRIRPSADRDLLDHATYFVENASSSVALRFARAASETFALLGEQPKMGWSSRFSRPGRETRLFRIPGFERILILYRPFADGVDILRVLHSSRDLDALLSDEPFD